MDFLGVVAKFRENALTNVQILEKLGFAPRQSVEEINAVDPTTLAASLAALGTHIHPAKIYTELRNLGLGHFDLLVTVSQKRTLVTPMGTLVLEDARRDLIDGLPPQLAVMIINSLLRPTRERITALENFSAGAVAEAIRKASKILVVTGAGTSTSCGIPDFRSPGGVYSIVGEEFPELKETPQKLFSIDYFRKNVRPFFEFNTKMVNGLSSGEYKPSICHRFIAELEKRGKLLRLYTQNIDTLEKYAGVTRFIACHGSFSTVSCTRAKTCGVARQDADLAKDALAAGEVPRCPKCKESPPPSLNVDLPEGAEPVVCDLFDKGVLKHDIVMFGEALPDHFFEHIGEDCDEADLVIVIGTSLQVGPVNKIIEKVAPEVPQVLINREVVAKGHPFDAELLGDCDAVVQALLAQLGWDDVSGVDAAALDPAVAQCKPSAHASAKHRWIFANGVDEDSDEEDDDGGHGHSHGGGHGHSHGGQPCHGHGHGQADAQARAQAQAHGHSHGGQPCHGHGHGAPAPSRGTTAAGKTFLAANAKKAGWVVLPSGLQYKVLATGPRPGPSPLVSTPCQCHYVGTTVEGVEFDSSYKRGQPSTFAPNQVIAGWTEALTSMVEGDKWALALPSELAYGDRQRGAHITPGAVLLFTVELVKVMGPSKQLV